MNASESANKDFNRKFEAWFNDWGRDLWCLCVYSARVPNGVEEDFPEILELTRRKMRARLRKLNDETMAQLFFKEWLLLQKAKNARLGASASELSDEDRILVGALFRIGWSFNKTSKVFGISPTSVRYRCLQALKKNLQIADRSIQPLGRDCVRSDLFLLDHMLGLKWSDPMRFFSPDMLAKHVKSCPRCEAFKGRLEIGLRQIQELKIAPMPSHSLEIVKVSPNLSSRWLLLTWISTWPWYIRVPFQILFSAAVVFIVVTVPYLGDIFPELNRYLPDLKSRIRSATSHFMQTPAKPALPPIASVNALPKAPPAALAPVTVAPAVNVAVASAFTPPVVVAKVKPAPPVPVPAAPPPPVFLPPAAAVAKNSVATPAENPETGESGVAVPETSPEETASSKPANPKTFFQWGAFTPDLEGAGQKITALLTKYHAERAGELDLGAQHLGGLYYHFNVPDAEYEGLVAEMNGLGMSRFTRNKARGIKDHPAGKTRVVFLLKPGH